MRKLNITLLVLLPVVAFGQSWKETSEAAAQAYHAGHYDQALLLTREAIRSAQEEFGTSHINYFTSVGDLATILKKKGQYAEAQKIELENMKAIERALGTENITYINALKNLGNTSLELEEYQQAEIYYNTANAQISKIIGKQDQYYQTNSLYVFDAYMAVSIQLGVLYQRMGKNREAEQIYMSLISFCKNYLGANYTEYLLYAVLINSTLSNIGF
jgi:tetratricopeptide (TPR) repeat protein